MHSNITRHGNRWAGERCGEKMGTTRVPVMMREVGGGRDRNASHRRQPPMRRPSEHSSVNTVSIRLDKIFNKSESRESFL
jgi:hypothetical protein